ncbi:MAG: pectinesterase family protein [Melioribacteraceae bacterium]
MRIKVTLIFLLIILLAKALYSQENADIIVDKNGSGTFTSIQEAIESIPIDNKFFKIILVKNGLYQEKLFINKSYVAIVGESKDSTIIQFAELRKNWMLNNSSHFGSAVINIDTNTLNVTLANLTIHNNYGSLFGDHDHQFAILGFGTKVILINCNIIADGADTVSLWTEKNGMYYHSHCYFEGWVDYVCPRGWCYITDSKFYGHNLTASLWHKGNDDKNAKFVIRNSFIDGVEGFPLGRHHVDAQFFLIDCIFSENMADVPIFWPISPNAKEWIWGERHYYYNCHRVGGDYDWFKNNLNEAENSLSQEMIDAEWTFDGKWNPEKEMPSVLPFIFLEKPRNGSYNIDLNNITLNWVPSRNAESFNIYFWKSKFPQALKNGEKLKDGPSAIGEQIFVKHQTENSFTTNLIEPNSTYYWRVDEIIDGKTIQGKLYHFTTKTN